MNGCSYGYESESELLKTRKLSCVMCERETNGCERIDPANGDGCSGENVVVQNWTCRRLG